MSLIARVAQQRLERTEAEDLVDDVAEDDLALGHAERRAFLGDEIEQQRADLRFGARPLGGRQRLEVQAVEQLAMDVRLQLEVLRPRRLERAGRAAMAARHGEADDVERTLHGDDPRSREVPRNARRFSGSAFDLLLHAEELPREAAELRRELGVVRQRRAARRS